MFGLPFTVDIPTIIKLTLQRFGLATSSRSAIGSLLHLRSTEQRSSFPVERLVLKWSKAVWEMTLKLPRSHCHHFQSKNYRRIQCTKPLTVRLDSSRLSFISALLKSSSLNFSTVKHFESTDLLGIVVEIFAFNLG